MDILLYIAFFATLIFSMYAQFKVSSTFNKYSRVPTARGRSAADAARMILNSNGLSGVGIERVGGALTDHYDPRSNTLRLSDAVFSSNSAAAVGVAAHEAGHAIQHGVGYIPIIIRSKLVPVTNFASRISWLVILGGLILSMLNPATAIGYYLILIGIGLFATSALFQLVTLPCEFNASRRAMAELRASGWYTEEELRASRKVLTAAALTYVAALFVTVIQVLRLLLIFGRRRKR